MQNIGRRLRHATSTAVALARWPVFSRTSHRMVLALAQQGIAPRTVLDVGANKGQFTVAARNLLFPERIYAFEPLPAEAEALARNCAGYPEVSIYQVALGDNEAQATFHVNAHSHSSSLLPLGDRHVRAFPSAQEVEAIEVDVRRLDQMLDVSVLPAPILLKIDTQGFESRVLAGAEGVLEAIDHVVLETSFMPLYDGEQPFSALLQQVERMGFRLVCPVDALKDPSTGEFLQMDALFKRDR